MLQLLVSRHMPKSRNGILILSVCSFLLAGAFAGDCQVPAEQGKDKVAPREFVSHHRMTFEKEPMSYTAIAGETILEDREGAQEACIFTISYIKEGVDRPETRPITFLFNGGPGSSAVWLHLGAFGPRRIALAGEPGNPGAPPYQLADNPHSLLRYSDLVFIDPIGTGYSRALGNRKDGDYWGVDEDSAVLARFIKTYLTAKRRWNSPKYLAGESYGTIRASLLIRDLELNLLESVAFNGAILLSLALDVRTFLFGEPGNELPYVIDLPTYAATASYHRALPEQPSDIDAFLHEAQDFASSEYLAALFKGDSLPADQRRAIAEKLHRFTGLSTDYLMRSHLRVDQGRFLKELLRNRGQVLAGHDTRYTGKDPDDVGERVEDDPFLLGIGGPFVAMINNYLATELEVKITEPYKVFSMEAAQGWKRAGDSSHAFAGFLNTTPYLAEAAATNKDFRIFVASGIHDLTTAYYGTQYVLDHSGISKSQVTLKNYFGGHMMYLHLPTLQQMSMDIGAFMKTAR
ncbi:MAG: peptidase S10 [Acidobacteriota bacterium]